MQDIISIVAAFVSILALVVSIIALYSSNHYAEIEYAYKVAPKIEVHGILQAWHNPISEDEPMVAVRKYTVSVQEKNNLDKAYVIYANNRVEQLPLDDMEDILGERIEAGLDTEPNIKVGAWEYRYFFVYLMCLDGDGILYLLYGKSTPGCIEFNGISGVEIYGLAKEAHENEGDYQGEQIMAREYTRILKELPEYTNQ